VPTLAYYRRIFTAYILGSKSHLTFWHETPTENPNTAPNELGEYYMLFAEKADYRGHFDASGVPQLDYHGHIGLQYNPIAMHNTDSATTTYGAAPPIRRERRSFF
jgi:hypothetical protein